MELILSKRNNTFTKLHQFTLQIINKLYMTPIVKNCFLKFITLITINKVSTKLYNYFTLIFFNF